MTGVFYTYFHTRNDTGAVFYVGKGQGRRIRTLGSHNASWHSIVKSCGYTPHFAMIGLSESDALDHERLLIDCFSTMGVRLCNRTTGGQGVSGHRHSEASRKKMHDAQIGKPRSTEHKARISEGQRGHKLSDETRAKIGAANKGKPGRVWTQESRDKVKAALTGIIRGPMSEARKKQISDKQTGRPRGPMSIENKAKISAARRNGIERKRANVV